MKDQSIIITYHYVQRPDERPRMKGLLLPEFEGHIKQLQESGYKIAGLSEYLAVSENLKKSPPQKMAVLTFDDGLKCHFENVVPVLQKHGLIGAFFIITRPLEEAWMAGAHQIHLLLGLAPIKELVKETEEWLARNAKHGVVSRETISDAIKKMYVWDDPETGYFKYLLNVHLGEKTRQPLVAYLFNKFVGSVAEWVKKFYASEEDLKQMRALGMEIGSHSTSHQFLSRLSYEEQKNEIAPSKKTLERIVGEDVSLFAYPFGIETAFNEDSVRAVQEAGFRAAFAVKESLAAESAHLFSINRVDAKNLRNYL